MKLVTKHFGEIEVEENKIIRFEDGIPGFVELKNYILLSEQPDSDESVFYWLQSIENPELAFAMIDMINFMPDYNPLVEKEQISELGEYDPEVFLFYNIVVIPENIKDMTVNLKAPIIINEELKRGKQVVCTNEEYTIRHYLFK